MNRFCICLCLATGVVAMMSSIVEAGVTPFTLYVSPTGKDDAPGTEQAPLGSFRRAMTLVDAQGGSGEIVMLPGRYEAAAAENHVPPAPVGKSGEASGTLTIRGSSPPNVIFDGSRLLRDAKPLVGHKGVWTFEGSFGRRPPEMWEPATRTRYMPVADERSLAIRPGSCTLIDERTCAFSPTMSKDPNGLVFASSSRVGFFVDRPNVTIKGLSLENYLGWRYSAGIDVRKDNVTVENCTVRNSTRGFSVFSDARNTRFINCKTLEVGCGVYTNGLGTIVERCILTGFTDQGLTGRNDPYRIPIYQQDNVGIEYYAPAKDGIARLNQIKGFYASTLVKAEPGNYLFEYNTLLNGVWFGAPGTYETTTYRANIIAFESDPKSNQELQSPGAIFERNFLIGSPGSDGSPTPIKLGKGSGNLIGDPQFAGPGDLRLLASSPAVAMPGNDRPAGADGVVPAGFVSQSAPELTIEPTADLVPECLITKDLPSNVIHLTKTNTFKVNLIAKAFDARVTRIKLRVNERPEQIVAFTPTLSVTIDNPREKSRSDPQNQPHTVEVSVEDSRGNWSASTTLIVRVASQPPALIRQPKMEFNTVGAVLSFATDRPVVSSVKWRRASGSWRDLGQVTQVSHQVEIGEGASTQTRHDPRTEHVFMLRYYNPIEPGTYECQIQLADAFGRSTDLGTVALPAVMREASEFFVSPDGSDQPDARTPTQPWKTLQAALDRALPGDTVWLMPGVYSQAASLTAGGTKERPITIAAKQPGTVILDGLRRFDHLLTLSDASFVVIRNIQFRWFRTTGISAMRSPNLTVQGCSFINHYWTEWPDGIGILVQDSPRASISNCVFARSEYGMVVWSSPDSDIRNNSATSILYGAVWYVYSAKGARLVGNSFCYMGNGVVRFHENDEESLKALGDVDFNNYATFMREQLAGEVFDSVKPELPYCEESKGIFDVSFNKGVAKRFKSMASWRAYSGKDTHSIFADPRWVDPATDRWELKAGSPNLGTGPQGGPIGAFGQASLKQP